MPVILTQMIGNPVAASLRAATEPIEFDAVSNTHVILIFQQHRHGYRMMHVGNNYGDLHEDSE
jgi:hypothetical protein